MSHDRPTHAETVRPALIELPLWLVWRVVDGAHRVQDYAASVAAAYTDATPAQRRLLAAVVCALCVLFLAGVLLTRALI